ncbi:MAG: MBL fold metallo-hydrolase [Chlamydiales bacterium]|nr:MBL fold metallo-hydrolase [Chlamydiales bacterium]
MIFERFEEIGLSHYSYAIGCSKLGQIAIIDPRYDVDLYLEYAEQNRLVISHVFETHIHADYASGARHLAVRAGAELVLSAYDKGEKYEVNFPHHPCFDGDMFQLGEVTLKVLHTPGHTPEHLSFLVFEEGIPKVLFSGDFLMVGTLGRPDLLGEEAKVGLAKKLFSSVHTKLRTLPNDVVVCPAHGSGSFCGGGIGYEPFSTLGQERLKNPFLNLQLSEREFIDLILAKNSFCPDYFPTLKAYNSSNERKEVRSIVPLKPHAFEQERQKGAVVIDLRGQTPFCEGHIPGSICIGFGEKFGYWASLTLPYDRPLLIVTPDPILVNEAMTALARVGLFDVVGYLQGGINTWKESGFPIETLEEILPETFQEKGVVDVRSDREWESDQMDEALHIPCTELKRRLSELPERKATFVCAGGYRSVLAASLAKHHGHKAVAHLSGGLLACRGRRLTLI